MCYIKREINILRSWLFKRKHHKNGRFGSFFSCHSKYTYNLTFDSYCFFTVCFKVRMPFYSQVTRLGRLLASFFLCFVRQLEYASSWNMSSVEWSASRLGPWVIICRRPMQNSCQSCHQTEGNGVPLCWVKLLRFGGSSSALANISFPSLEPKPHFCLLFLLLNS